MVSYHVKHNYHLFSRETTFNTPVAPAKDIGLVQNCSPNAKNNVEVVYTTGTRLPQQLVAGQFEGNLDIDMYYQHARIFELALGTTPTHALTSSDTTHTIVDAGNSLPVAEESKSFTWEDGVSSGASAVVNRYSGVSIASLTLSIDVRGIVTVKASCPYADLIDQATAQSGVFSTSSVFPSWMATFKAGTNGSETSLVKVQSGEITFDNAPNYIMATGSRVAQDKSASSFAIRYRFSLVFSDASERNRFLSGATGTATRATGTPALQGFVFNANNGVTLGSGRREIDIQLRNIIHDEWSSPKQVGNVIIEEYSGVATQLYKLTGVDSITSANW